MGRILENDLCDALDMPYGADTLPVVNVISRQTCKMLDEMRGLSDSELSRGLDAPSPLADRKTNKSTQPLAQDASRSPFNNAIACGATCKRTGKPCKNPSMIDKARCRLHGGKSTGRPVVDGLRTKAFRRKKAATATAWARIKQAAQQVDPIQE